MTTAESVPAVVAGGEAGVSLDGRSLTPETLRPQDESEISSSPDEITTSI